MMYKGLINVCILLILWNTGDVSCYQVPSLIVNKGEDAELAWTLNPEPSPGEAVTILNNQGEILFVATLSDELHVSREGRILYTGYSDHGTVSFTLRKVNTSDAGVYSARRKTKVDPGLRLVVVDKPDRPMIIQIINESDPQQIILNCSTRSNTKPEDNDLHMKYTWYWNGEVIDAGGRFHIYESKLLIKDIVLKDNGTRIECIAFESAKVASAKSPIHYLAKNCKPRKVIPQVLALDPPVLGKDFRLNCSLNGTVGEYHRKLNFKWTKQNKVFNDDSHNDRYQQNGTILSVTNISFDDDGTLFRCHIKDVNNCIYVQENGEDYRLVVLYGPKLAFAIPDTDTYFVQEGDSFNNVSCHSRCNPPCTFQWTKHGSNILQENQFLLIANVTPGDYGTYRCIAKNQYGSAVSNHVMLHRKGKAAINIIHIPKFSMKEMIIIGGSSGGLVIIILILVLIVQRRRVMYRRRSVKTKLQIIALKLKNAEDKSFTRKPEELPDYVYSDPHYHTIDEPEVEFKQEFRYQENQEHSSFYAESSSNCSYEEGIVHHEMTT